MVAYSMIKTRSQPHEINSNRTERLLNAKLVTY